MFSLGDGSSSPFPTFVTFSDSVVDSDFIDELSSDGFWLETTNAHFSVSPLQQIYNDESEINFRVPQPPLYPKSQELVETQTRNHKAFEPADSSVKKRLMQAAGYLKDCRDVLVQIWVPIKKGGKHVLTTSNQPFYVDPNCKSLADYRSISETYQFPAEEGSKESIGMPGRVFLGKLPEWTPDVRFFRSDEYPRIGYAQQFNVRGSIAFPVFEQDSETCLGVVEIVTIASKINYSSELEEICTALEAVELRSSLNFSPLNVEACSGLHQAVLPEIADILTSVCNMHNLPVALTWAPCIRQSKGGCRHSNENYVHCVSTVDNACFAANEEIFGFHEACSDHHLLRDQGIVGRAFSRNKPCFTSDIKSLSKTEYPLSHHARMFGLQGAVAIPLRNIYTGSVEFVMEFFFPKDCRDAEEQKRTRNSFFKAVQQACQSLQVVMDQELEEEVLSITSNGKLKEEETHESTSSSPKGFSVEGFSFDGLKDNSYCFGGRKAGYKRRTRAEKTISLQVLRQYFSGSLTDAAKSIGVCPTTLKRICRQHGITRWPSRKIKKVGHSLKKLQLVIDSVQGVESAIQIESFYTSFPELNSNFSANGPLSSLKTNPQPCSGVVSPVGSQSSGLSTCFSGDALMTVNPGPPLKRARNDAELHVSNEEEPKIETILFVESSGRNVRDGGSIRVKASFGNEKIRFSLQPNSGFRDLQQEIAKRLSIEDFSSIDLKYMDDDLEWVLLTCNADLEECVDIHKSSQCHTIKLSIELRFFGI